MDCDFDKLLTLDANVDLPSQVVANARKNLPLFFEQLEGTDTDWFQQALSKQIFVEQLIKVWGASPFVFEACITEPGLLKELLVSGDLSHHYPKQAYQQRLSELIQKQCTTEQTLHTLLRQFRRREMIRLVWRDFSRQASMEETTGDVTRLAEACIDQSLLFLYPLLCKKLGAPIGQHSGKPQHLIVLGMGKMGGRELNLSSDIDLIFTFPEAGKTHGARRSLSNQEFFVRLGQQLIKALDTNTADGFVFRVDMRLRPYGQSGALVLNFDALTEYYQAQGRDWERYAMIKARVVAGDKSEAIKLMAILTPFCYRKYIDFSVIQSLRNMKALINREVKRLGATIDIKKSAGGIREIEFIAQAFQLIRGGKDQRFQTPSLQKILLLLDSESLLPKGRGVQLWEAYEFLRNTEHGLQGHRDRQTQLLPEDDYGQACLAAVMEFSSWELFFAALEKHRHLVRTIFADIVSDAPQENQEPPELQAARAGWLDSQHAENMAVELKGQGYVDPDPVARALFMLRESMAVKALDASVRDRLDLFMPLLIEACTQQVNSSETLLRILPMIQAVLRRSVYLVLLIENHSALIQLVRLCSDSVWIARQVGRYPALLDELLDARTLYTAVDKTSMAQELRQLMLRIPEEGLEEQMEALRYFRRAQSLRIAACEQQGVLALMKVSDNLTWLAEVVLEQVKAMAWHWMVVRNGHPGKKYLDDPAPNLLVVGYGKLGGVELGHSSDLDLVFIHNAEPGLLTDGVSAIDNSLFFTRLGQRMLHILGTQTLSGALYSVDTRLRPNGNSGLLVTTLAAFQKYQLEEAWTWEHQALVRARAVAGDLPLAKIFLDIRKQVLCKSRDQVALRKDVIAMRDKMRVHLGSSQTDVKSGLFRLKQDMGGIVDIEFMVQFAVLANARNMPELTRLTDNIGILDALEATCVLSSVEATALREAYIAYRTMTHRLQLQEQDGVVKNQAVSDHREAVTAIYQRLLVDT